MLGTWSSASCWPCIRRSVTGARRAGPGVSVPGSLERRTGFVLAALRDRQKWDRATGGTSILSRLGEIEDRDMAIEDEDRDWQQWAFCWAAGQVEREVAPTTWRAFWLTAVDGDPPSEVGGATGDENGHRLCGQMPRSGANS